MKINRDRFRTAFKDDRIVDDNDYHNPHVLYLMHRSAIKTAA